MTDQPQPLDLDAIEARTNAATPGPWQWHISCRTRDYRLQTVGWDIVMGFTRWGRDSAQPEFNIDGVLHNGVDLDQPHPDAEFIANARQDVDDLVAEVRRLTAELEQARPELCADCGHLKSAHYDATGDDDVSGCNASGAKVRSCNCWYFIPAAVSGA